MEPPTGQAQQPFSKPRRKETVRRLWVLWGGLLLYFLIMVNSFRYAGTIPYQFLILAALVNAAIILTIIIAIRRAYRRLKE